VERRFIKTVPPADAAMLDAEADGLRALRACSVIKVPEVLDIGMRDGVAFLETSWLDFADLPRGEAMGRALARLHRIAQGSRFGWHLDNFIGRTPQVNAWDDAWVRFFRDRRLRPQFELASAHRLRGADALLDAVPHLLRDHAPAPSLLHGDLWGGNWAADARGEPVVFDPAVYFGDREADLAMTRLFGGFGPAFYAAYQSDWPLDQAAGTRRGFYNLYHVLNHFNLFGGGYAAQAEGLIDGLLAELGH
jgi:fructosamine-3-kinase